VARLVRSIVLSHPFPQQHADRRAAAGTGGI